MTIAKRRSERGWDAKRIDKRVVGDEGPAAMAWEVAATANDAKAQYRLGDALIEAGLGRPYDGGARQGWCG